MLPYDVGTCVCAEWRRSKLFLIRLIITATKKTQAKEWEKRAAARKWWKKYNQVDASDCNVIVFSQQAEHTEWWVRGGLLKNRRRTERNRKKSQPKNFNNVDDHESDVTKRSTVIAPRFIISQLLIMMSLTPCAAAVTVASAREIFCRDRL